MCLRGMARDIHRTIAGSKLECYARKCPQGYAQSFANFLDGKSYDNVVTLNRVKKSPEKLGVHGCKNHILSITMSLEICQVLVKKSKMRLYLKAEL